MTDLELRIAEYALGTLPEIERADVERELADSEVARELLTELVAALESVEPDLEPLEPSPELREAVLAQVDPERKYDAFAPRLARLLDLPGERIDDLLGILRDPEGESWIDTGFAQTRIFHFEAGPRLAEAHCGLVSVAGGETYPAHRHLGDEWAFVLSGSAEDSNGELWRPGDLVCHPEGSDHRFTVHGDEPLVFLLVLFGGIELI